MPPIAGSIFKMQMSPQETVKENFSKYINFETDPFEDGNKRSILDFFKHHIADNNLSDFDEDLQKEILLQCKIESFDNIVESFSNFDYWSTDPDIEELELYDGEFHDIFLDDFGEIYDDLYQKALLSGKDGKNPVKYIFIHDSWFIGDTYRLEVTFDHELQNIIGWSFVTD